MHRYKILDGFSIVSSGVEGQPIHKITTSASEEPSDTSLLTEKGVVDLVEQVEGEITSGAIMKDLITTEGGLIVGGENGEPLELTPNETDVEMALMSSSGEVDWKQITGIHAYDAEIEATSGSILKLKGSMGISAEAGQMINTRAKNIITSASNLISTSADSEIDRTAPYIKDTVSNYYALITGPETGLKYNEGQLGIYGSTLAITETGGISQTTSGNFQLKGLRFSAEAYASDNQGTKYESDPGHAEILSKSSVSSGSVVVACEEVLGSCSNSNGNQAAFDVRSNNVVLEVIDGNGADTGVQVTSAGVFVHPTTNTGSFSVSVPSLDHPPQTLTITSGGSTFSGENFSVVANTVREGVVPNITIGTPNGTETIVASTSMVRLSSAGVQITGAENPVTIHGSASSMEISSGGIRFIAPTNVLRVYTSGMEITAGARLTSANSSAVIDVEETAPSGSDDWNGILATSYDNGALYRFGVRKGVVRSAYEADDETIPTEKAVREAIDAGGGGGNLPISSAGDMIYGNMWGEAEALPIGDLGQVLTVNSSGLPEWITPQSGGMTNPMTTSGDIIVGGTGGSPSRLGAGNDGDVLTLDNGIPTWMAGGGGGSGSDRPTTWQTGAFNSYFDADGSGGVYIICVWGNALPDVIKSFSVWFATNPYALPAFAMWVAIYDRTADNSPLVSSFTWDNSKHPSTNWNDVEATFNFDSPITIDHTHFYRVVFKAKHGTLYANVPTISVKSPSEANKVKEWGTNSVDTSLYTYTPPPTYSFSGSWQTTNEVPFIRLNAFSGDY